MMDAPDKLDLIFCLQRQLQKRIGFDIKNMDKAGRQAYIEKMFIGIITELSEAVEETPWKRQWKKSNTGDQERFKEEIVDAWHFLINLTLASGMDAEALYFRYTQKHRINIKRQKDKY